MSLYSTHSPTPECGHSVCNSHPAGRDVGPSTRGCSKRRHPGLQGQISTCFMALLLETISLISIWSIIQTFTCFCAWRETPSVWRQSPQNTFLLTFLDYCLRKQFKKTFYLSHKSEISLIGTELWGHAFIFIGALIFRVGLLLGVPAEEWDRAVADSVHARRRGQAEKLDWLHHLYDQCSTF